VGDFCSLTSSEMTVENFLEISLTIKDFNNVG